ncbi:RHS repeat-associated core domain-containing protein [Nocardia fusca]|uniref:DUF6531 domain-containing protein n=1 Tax=Nocardia fusca TaxID=941183 RepID=A0ABV3F0F4_9NOCA
MSVSKRLVVAAGQRLGGIARNIADGWSRHSPNHDNALQVAAKTHIDAETRATAGVRGATPAPPLDTPRMLGTESRSAQRNAIDRATADRGVAHTALTNRSEMNRTADQVTVCNDPVDVATGEFVLPATDLGLPGVLPLVLRRRHRSGYRFGRWFGPSWSATIDMRVVVDAGTLTFVGEDGLLLVYSHPEQNRPVLPINGGPQWPLAAGTAGGYVVTDPDRELSWHFAVREPGTVDRQHGGYVLSAICDRYDNRIRFHYDQDGTPVAIDHSGGYRVRIDAENGRVVALRVLGRAPAEDSVDTVREFRYRAGRLASVRNAVGAVTRYTYDAEQRMTSWTDSNGNRMSNTYDGSGRVVAQHGSSGILDARFEYSTDPERGLRRTVHIDSAGAATEYSFDRAFRLCERIDPVGGRNLTEYTDDGRPVRLVAADGAATTYRYDADGNPVEIVRPDGLPVRITYTDRQRVAAIIEADGASHLREWDRAGDLAAMTTPDGRRTEYSHHRSGAVATVTESTGARTRIEVDAAGLPVRVTDADGAVTTVARDHFGRPVTVTDALGGVTTYIWSGGDRLVGRVDPDGHGERWAFDGEGNLTEHTDRAGNRTRFDHGAFDLLRSRTGPDGATTRYTWDTQRRLVEVTSPLGDTWHYTHDAAGRCIGETDYSGALTVYTRDPCGRVATVTTATGVTRTHRYDVLGRATEVVADTGEWRRYTYDAAGRMTTAVSGLHDSVTHTVRFAHARDGRLLAQQVDDRAPSTFEYDRHGRRVTYSAPSGVVTGWQYDAAGRVTGMRSDGRRLDFSYDRLGRHTGWRTGALTVDRVYSGVGHTIAQIVGTAATGPDDGAPIRRDDYVWRPDGYPLEQATVEGHGAPVRREYTLDEIGRVTDIVSGDRVLEQYRYDRLGNILSAGVNGATGGTPAAVISTGSTDAPDPSSGRDRREYRRNTLVRRDRTRFHYDAAGRLVRSSTSRPTRTPDIRHYRYDAFDQLTELRTPAGDRWCYTYDALGRRTAKQRLADDETVLEKTEYTWDGNRVTEQTTEDTTTHWSYRPGTHIPLTQIIDQDGAEREFAAIVTDLVGAPIRLLTATGQVAAGVTHTLWGETTWSGGRHSLLRFPGQLYDPESGLHYNLHRMYDPATGRYLTRDPLGLGPAPNPVAYPHNPLTWCDPMGLVPTGCEPARTHRDFAHGTSADHAEYIMLYGLNAQVARTASAGGAVSRPGAFFTHEVDSGKSPGFQAAYEWGLRHSTATSPSTVLVGRLPESTYQNLVERGLVTVRPVGHGVPDETIFNPWSFHVLNDQMEWIAKVTPET